MAQNRRTIFRRSGTITSATTTDLQLITLTDKVEAWFFLGVRFVRTSGAGANYQLRLRRNIAGTNGDIDELYTGSSTAVATATNDVMNSPVPFDTDSTGRVFFKPGFDGGIDNDYGYVLWFEKAVGS